MKSPKKEVEEEDDDFLEDLVVDTDPEKPKKKTMYSNLKPGGLSQRLKIAKAYWIKDRRESQQQENRTMMMMMMMKMMTKGKTDNYRASGGKVKEQWKRPGIKRKKKKHDDSVSTYKVEYF